MRDVAISKFWQRNDSLTQAVMTPVDLVDGADDETNLNVTNIARFLQSIDDDGVPDNGIAIAAAVRTAAAGKTLDFTQASADFEAAFAAAAVTANPIVSVADAQSHLRDNLLERLAGAYSGTLTGVGSGTFSVTIDSDGVILGNGVETGIGSFAVTGTVASIGTGTFGSAGVADFTGTVNPDTGAVSGAWTSGAGNGAYSGQKQ